MSPNEVFVISGGGDESDKRVDVDIDKGKDGVEDPGEDFSLRNIFSPFLEEEEDNDSFAGEGRVDLGVFGVFFVPSALATTSFRLFASSISIAMVLANSAAERMLK